MRADCSTAASDNFSAALLILFLRNKIMAASKKNRNASRTLLSVLKTEKDTRLNGGIYHKVQIELTYNSNHIEGSRLTEEQTRSIFDMHAIESDQSPVNVDDIVETANHFRCIDRIIDRARYPLTAALIKKLHGILKNGTSDSRLGWFAVGDYKRLPNEIAGKATTVPKDVPNAMKRLIADYEGSETKTLDDLLGFHYEFESIHPFQDGNGRIGRLILFKECLRWKIVPFIISDELKFFYYRGLREWKSERGYLRDTCLTAQDSFKKTLDYFEIVYDD